MRFLTIGRSPDSHVFIDDPTVSRRHAELVITKSGEYYLSDCASTAGTFLKQKTGWCSIRQSFVNPNDSVKFGAIETNIQHLLSV